MHALVMDRELLWVVACRCISLGTKLVMVVLFLRLVAQVVERADELVCARVLQISAHVISLSKLNRNKETTQAVLGVSK